jgi:hypothetical protein
MLSVAETLARDAVIIGKVLNSQEERGVAIFNMAILSVRESVRFLSSLL